ncbi:MAG: hypothetical protein R3F42_11270 [Pseudomonadota bacterium]
MPVTGAPPAQLRVTVLRSTDPTEVRELLGRRRTVLGAERSRRAATRRNNGNSWQVVLEAGQTALVSAGDSAPAQHVPWLGYSRHGPAAVVSASPVTHERGLLLQVHRRGDQVVVHMAQFSQGASALGGAGLATVLHGGIGQWLDAGGNLLLPPALAGIRQVQTQRGDPRYFRLLVRVDALD